MNTASLVSPTRSLNCLSQLSRLHLQRCWNLKGSREMQWKTLFLCRSKQELNLERQGILRAWETCKSWHESPCQLLINHALAPRMRVTDSFPGTGVGRCESYLPCCMEAWRAKFPVLLLFPAFLQLKVFEWHRISNDPRNSPFWAVTFFSSEKMT